MRLSIRHDLDFQESLAAYADAQNEVYVTPHDSIAGTPAGDKSTLEAEQAANRATKLLCDAIDRYADRYARHETEIIMERERATRAAARQAKRKDKAA